jgi:hypothetical protein
VLFQFKDLTFRTSKLNSVESIAGELPIGLLFQYFLLIFWLPNHFLFDYFASPCKCAIIVPASAFYFNAFRSSNGAEFPQTAE